MAGWDKTQKGRIVYDRKEHPFTIKDLLRIAHKVPTTIYALDTGDYELVSAEIEQIIGGRREFPGFGGGEAGGGGASGVFSQGEQNSDLPDQPRVVMIVESLE